MALEQSFEYQAYDFSGFLMDDVIGATNLYLDGTVGSIEEGRLSLSLGAGVAYSDDNNGLLSHQSVYSVLPGSALTYEVQAGPVLLTIYDRVSVRPSRFAVVTPYSWRSAQQNDLGFAVDWQIDDQWALMLNYNWSRSEVGWNLGRRSIQTVTARVSYTSGSPWTVGLDANVGFIDAGTPFQHDGNQWQAGLFASRELWRHQLRLSAGYQRMDFDSSLPMWLGFAPFAIVFATGDRSDASAPYYRVSIAGRLHERISHELAFGFESTLGTFSNSVSAHYANYGITAAPWTGGRITASGYLEAAERSGGVFARDTFQYGADLQLQQRLSARWAVGMGYHFGSADADLALPLFSWTSRPANFQQHGVALHCDYQIGKHWSARLAVQSFFVENTDPLWTDYRQDRVILSVRLAF